MYVIGTAGHVDHGKSTLVKTLTGIDPDRLAEEQRREMTIDLGFAWLTLPSGRSVSLIDVPGHERFIKNMLAGVGGLDAALLVVAADESLMPQTREHLAILDLLEVRHGVVAITKADLVDADWLELVREEVAAGLRGTSLANAALVPVSARSGLGLDALRSALDRALDATPSRTAARGAPRLPVDRSFTIGGFGTVVTGTLIDGPLSVGQELVVLPAGLRARVRGLQSHKQREETALPGTRVAVNLAGVHHSEVARGDVLALPDSMIPTSMLDVQIRVLADAPAPLAQNDGLDLFTGAAEVRCRLTLLDAERLPPGASGWAQLRLERPVAVARGDRCILRVASPSRTVAGGTVVDPHPPRHRRFRPEVVAALETLARGDPAELLLQALGDGPPRPVEEVTAGMGAALAAATVAQLAEAGRVIVLPEETRRHGDKETRRHGDTETRRHGDTETRRQGDSLTLPIGAPCLPVSLSPCLWDSWSPQAAGQSSPSASYHRCAPSTQSSRCAGACRARSCARSCALARARSAPLWRRQRAGACWAATRRACGWRATTRSPPPPSAAPWMPLWPLWPAPHTARPRPSSTPSCWPGPSSGACSCGSRPRSFSCRKPTTSWRPGCARRSQARAA